MVSTYAPCSVEAYRPSDHDNDSTMRRRGEVSLEAHYDEAVATMERHLNGAVDMLKQFIEADKGRTRRVKLLAREHKMHLDSCKPHRNSLKTALAKRDAQVAELQAALKSAEDEARRYKLRYEMCVVILDDMEGPAEVTFPGLNLTKADVDAAKASK